MWCIRSCGIRTTVWNKQAVLGALHKLQSAEKIDAREYHDVMGDVVCPSQVMGISHLRDPRLNKVMKISVNFQI